MDQLKVALKYLQKYHFWLLCIVAIIAGLVGSMMAGRSLSAVYAQEKQKIEAKFQSLAGILGTDPHPNTRWKEGVDKLNAQERAKVRKAWDLVYEDQKKLLTWPPELKEDFLKFIAENPANAEIPKVLCSRYGNYIKDEFPRLLKIVDAAPFTATKGPGNTPAARAAAKNDDEAAHEYRVTWDSANETEIHKTLDWESTPSSAEVRRAQEDLWVYTALLTIIKNVNDEQQYTTPVREIVQIQIGKPAADSFEASLASEHIIHLQAAEKGASSTTSSASTSGEPGAVKPIDDGRYVDENGKKLGPGATADAEFKRMPIFLKLKIDQRQIPRFLVECANSPLPIEVRQLRINASKGGATSRSSQAGSKSGAGTEGTAYELPIELHGILYIYNKPNMAKLGGDPAGAPVPPQPTG